MAEQEKPKSQWMHLELYSRSGTLNKSEKNTKTSVGGVVNEAIRTPGFVDHILQDGGKPSPPSYTYSVDGKTLDQHMGEILTQVETERDPMGRKIRADKNILLAGTASYPKPVKADNWTPDDRQNYELWKEQTLDFLKTQFGENLICVLEHQDEAYPHLHFYAVNRQRISETPILHPGHASNIKLEKEAKSNGKKPNSSEMTKAYRAAMRDFQDAYYNEVSVYCGFDRLGPKVQRMNRNEWKARKQSNKKMRDVVRKLKVEAGTIQEKGAKIEKLATALEVQMAENQEWENRLEQEAKALESGTKDLELAQYVKKNNPEIAASFNIQYARKKIEKQGQPGRKFVPK